MNIMLVSVHERTREIGLRKAVGARRPTPRSSARGAVYLLGGAAGTPCHAIIRHQDATGHRGPDGDTSRGTDIHLFISPDVLVTATVILVLAGVLAGFWPAVRASRLDPIEALRYE
jgi:putative ABC transport system permease protein